MALAVIKDMTPHEPEAKATVAVGARRELPWAGAPNPGPIRVQNRQMYGGRKSSFNFGNTHPPRKLAACNGGRPVVNYGLLWVWWPVVLHSWLSRL